MRPQWATPDAVARLDIHAEDDRAVHQWANVLGVEAVMETRTGGVGPFRVTSADGTVDGVPVHVWYGTHLLDGGEQS
jgi:hypothetical protein